jgi:hypothetical protein
MAIKSYFQGLTQEPDPVLQQLWTKELEEPQTQSHYLRLSRDKHFTHNLNRLLLQTDNLKLNDYVEKKLLANCTVGVSKLFEAILRERQLVLNLLRAFVALPVLENSKSVPAVGLSVLG